MYYIPHAQKLNQHVSCCLQNIFLVWLHEASMNEELPFLSPKTTSVIISVNYPKLGFLFDHQ